MTSATIKLFLPRGDAKSLRTAEISNWTGKAVAAPRTELDELLAREELDKAGVYLRGSKLPESDREDMEVFLSRIRQLLPVLGSDILSPISHPDAKPQRGGVLRCRMKGAEGRGQRTPNGFVVFSGSTAVLEERPSMKKYPYVMAQRKELIAEGVLTEKYGFLVFTKDTEFSSPSAAAAVIHGGSANGLIAWKTEGGKSLKQLDEQA